MIQEKLSELLELIEKAETSNAKADALNNLAWEQNHASQFEDAVITVGKALSIAVETGNTYQEGRAFNILGIISKDQNDCERALQNFKRSLTLFELLENKEWIANVIGNIGMVYNSLSDYSNALQFYFKSLALNEENGRQYGIAANLGNIGNIYLSLSDYPRALQYYHSALATYEELGDKAGIANNLGNIGSVYNAFSDYPRALEFHYRALAIYEELGANEGIGRNFGNIGNIYNSLDDYSRALEFYTEALKIFEELRSKPSIAINLGNMGNVYSSMGENPLALEYYNSALLIFEELGSKIDIARNLSNIGNVFYSYYEYTRALEYYGESLEMFENLGDKSGIASNLGKMGTLYANQMYEGYNPVKAEEYVLHAMDILEEIGEKIHLSDLHRSISKLYKVNKRWEESLLHFERFHELENEIHSETAKRHAEKFMYDRQTAENEKNLAIERARAQATDEILANILPANITERLIKGEKKIADAHENVSVLFADIVGFTRLSSKLTAAELIDVLDIIFSRFDMICKKHGLEKIKTIGDAYMAVCGAPIECENHAERVAKAALEMMEDFTIDSKFSVPMDFGFRIGLHSGSVVAGIIGENKYSYDLWGDAVNTASRMESYGEEDKIHVSEEFRNFVGDAFTFIERGEMEIKGKGMMKTYFLEQAK